jgi:hypothetical protein
MTAMSLTESLGKFAATLDELRRKHLGAFESWLKGALATSASLSQRELVERIAGTRKAFADDFINERAPALLATLAPNSKLDVVQQLRAFAAHADRLQHFDPTSRDDTRWQPGVLRPLIGAALGAAASLLVFLLQASAPAPAQIPAAQQPATQVAPPTGAPPADPAAASPQGDKGDKGDKGDRGDKADSPSPSQPTSAPARSAPPSPRPAFEQSALLVISGAAGAAFGAFVVLCPPFRRSALTGAQSGMLGIARRAGLALLLLRGGLMAVAVSAAVTAIAGLAGFIFTGPKPVWTILLGLAALFLIVLFRWAFPKDQKQDRLEAARRTAIAALDRELSVDAELWATLAAALVLQPARTATPDPKLDHVRSIILARRDRCEPGEDILRIVEQELALPGGPSATAPSGTPAVFPWEPRHADLYEPFGLVKVGDMVEVKVAPQMASDARGVAAVFKKGTVVRKR